MVHDRRQVSIVSQGEIISKSRKLISPDPVITTPPLRSLGVRASARGAGDRSSIPGRVTPDVKGGRFALLSLALGINELGNRLGGSESL